MPLLAAPPYLESAMEFGHPHECSVAVLPFNEHGRDFVVGDIHGQKTLLFSALSEIGFDFNNDRLFSCGDLIDRGAESAEVLELANHSWFYPVRGNHDDMLVDAARDGFDSYNARAWMFDDGSWIRNIDDERRFRLARIAASLPTVISVCTPDGAPKFHVVHAEILPDDEQVVDNASVRELHAVIDPYIRERLVWGRSLIRISEERTYLYQGEGLSPVFCGHSIVQNPVRRGGQYFMDTGAFLEDGALSFADPMTLAWIRVARNGVERGIFEPRNPPASF